MAVNVLRKFSTWRPMGDDNFVAICLACAFVSLLRNLFQVKQIFTRGLMLSMSQIGKQGSRIAIVEVDSQMAPAINTM